MNNHYLHQLCFIFFVLCQWQSGYGELFIDPKPVTFISNPYSDHCFINSVDCHPNENLFCVTYTHVNKVVIYRYDLLGGIETMQVLENPTAKLSEPQHAIFTPDGEKMIVANWKNQTLTIYPRKADGEFNATPAAIIRHPVPLIGHKPHGIAISPCGNFLAIAYGATTDFKRAIAVFSVSSDGCECKLLSLIKKKELKGTPKGITFSPDGSCLLVTFSDTYSISLFDFDRESQMIDPIPRQIIQGQESALSRSEDIKISPNGKYCAVTNSDQQTVTFYHYDSILNYITDSVPVCILQGAEAQLSFPHGIAFSPDGTFLMVTDFGSVSSQGNGGVIWDNMTLPNQANIKLFRCRLYCLFLK